MMQIHTQNAVVMKSILDAAFQSEGLRALAARGVVRRYQKGAIFISEGEVGGSLYLIAVGRVRIYSADESGREFVHAVRGSGDYVGELAMDGGPRSASVQTLEPTICVAVDKAVLLEHFALHPEFAMELLSRVIHVSRVATSNAKALALLDVYQRVTTLLEQLAIQMPDGSRMIPERLTQKELADRVGASREMVSKILKDLTTGGYIVSERQRYRLVQPLPGRW